MTEKQSEIEALAARLGLTMKAAFVPWSQSRNVGEKHPSLNWRVAILKAGKTVLTTDYMAGCAHCPGYKQRTTYESKAVVAWECEHGKEGIFLRTRDAVGPSLKAKPILPTLADVLISLVSDAEVIDYGDFEEWAESLGFDTDSRKAEAIYRACLDIGLKLRKAVGDDGFSSLREAFRDY